MERGCFFVPEKISQNPFTCSTTRSTVEDMKGTLNKGTGMAQYDKYDGGRIVGDIQIRDDEERS